MEKITIEEAVQAVKAEIAHDWRLKKCINCILISEDQKSCVDTGLPVAPYTYGCPKHITNEQALRKIAEQEMKSYQEQMTRLLLRLDIMSYLVNGASMVLEVIDRELDADYNALTKKDEETVSNHKESKRNRDRLRKAYKSMKFSLQDIRNTYERYVEYFFATLFTEDDGRYNVKESDKNLFNAGTVTAFVNLFVDCSLDNSENCNAIMDFMKKLKRSGIFAENEHERYLIKR